MPTLKYLFRLAGPKILTLLALAVARTLLSNRLARLQVCQGVSSRNPSTMAVILSAGTPRF